MKNYKTIFLIFVCTASFSFANAQRRGRSAEYLLGQTALNIWKDSFSLDNKPAKWTYDQGVILKGIEGLWNTTGDGKYFRYIQQSMDFFVDKDGNIKTYRPDEFTLDNINNGKILLLLYKVIGNEKYWKAATQLREQLRKQPRTSDGGFWHKKIYPYQMWLDGLYMAAPFYAEYAAFAHEDTAFNDIARQFILMEKHARDEKTGLLYHGWDESKQQKWADPKTGRSPNFWGRAMGWYGMALVDALDWFPPNHPQRKELIGILNRYVDAIAKVQDKKSGLWWDVLNFPGREKNYLEASASSMFVYTIAKSVRMGYIPATKLAVALKGYEGLVMYFIRIENEQTNLKGTVKVSGLGGNPYRNGSYEYYVGEPVIINDPKGVGAFISAANEIDLSLSQKIGKGKTVTLDNYFNNEWRKDVTGVDIPYHYTWNDNANSGFSMFGKVFEKYGMKKQTLTAAPTKENLKNTNIYIIVDPDTDKETAKPNYVQQKDVDVIADWAKQGGVLVLMANDSGNCEFTHFNELAERFGIHFNEDSKNHVDGNKFEQGAINIPANDAIFKNIKKIYIKELSTVSLWSSSAKNESARRIALKNGSDKIIAVVKYGKGTVFAVGDPWLYNEYVDGRKLPAEYENYKAAEDLVQWLIRQTKK